MPDVCEENPLILVCNLSTYMVLPAGISPYLKQRALKKKFTYTLVFVNGAKAVCVQAGHQVTDADPPGPATGGGGVVAHIDGHLFVK